METSSHEDYVSLIEVPQRMHEKDRAYKLGNGDPSAEDQKSASDN